jgi:hypothetical protein
MRLLAAAPSCPETQLTSRGGVSTTFQSCQSRTTCAGLNRDEAVIRRMSLAITPIRTSDHNMKRSYFPGIIDIVVVTDPAEIRTISNDARFDRDFIGRGPVRNVQRLRKMLRIFSLNGRLFPTLLPRTDPNRAAAQDRFADPSRRRRRDPERALKRRSRKEL